MGSDREAGDLAEAEVLALLRNGDSRGALTALMTMHGQAVYSRCLRIVGEVGTAQDVLQHTFLDAFRDLETFEQRSSFRTWLLGIATHRSLDAVRARRRRNAHLVDADQVQIEDLASPAIVSETAERAQRRRALEACLGKLDANIRAAVLMRFQEELTFEVMAERLGEKAGTLQARVARAMPALRKCLDGKGVAP